MLNGFLIFLVVVIIAVAAFSVMTAGYYYSSLRSGLMTKAKTATDFFESYITRTYSEYYDSAYRYVESFGDGDRLELQFIDLNGRIQLSSYGFSAGIMPGTDDIQLAIKNGTIESWQGRNSSTGEHLMAVSAPIIYKNGQVIGVMRYVTSLKTADSEIGKIILVAALIGIVIMLIVVFFLLFFTKSLVEPMREITNTARRIADGSYGIQIGKKYRDEMGEMVSALNEMSVKIGQSEKAQTEFISSVSHELRTPLTAISGWGETLMYDPDMTEDNKKGVEIILREARRLTKMVEELLDFTRMENGHFTLNAQPMDIGAELEDSIFAYREILMQDGMAIEYEPCSDELPLINGDPERLRQVFFNIFDNAAKYAPEGGRLDVSLTTNGADIFIRIRDYGPGIPEDELERVKLRFYKGSSKMRGSGIGLAVCDEIVKYHGGTLTLSNADGGGTLVTICIPIEPTFE